MQEGFLEAGGGDCDVGDAVFGEDFEEGGDVAGESEGDCAGVGGFELKVVLEGEGEFGGEFVEVFCFDDDVFLRLAVEVVAGFFSDYAAVFNKDKFVAEVFDFAEDVGGDEDGGAGVSEFADDFVEFGLHEGVEAGGGFVEDEEFGAVHEGDDEGDFLAVAGAEIFDFTGEVEVEAIGELHSVSGVLCGAESPKIFELLADGEIVVEPHAVCEEADVAAHMDGAGEDLFTEDESFARGGLDEAEEDVHGGGFASAVWAEKASDGAGFDVEVDV